MSAPRFALGDTVDVRFPGEPEAKRKLRRRLCGAHAAAVSRAQRLGGGTACEMYWRAAQLAGEWQFAAATEEQLNNVLIGLSGLFVSGNAFGRAEAHDE